MRVKIRLNRNIVLLGAVSFLNDISSEMIMPILPMFISQLGGSGVIIGLIGGLRDSIISILKVFCGYWSDRIGRRKVFVFFGYLIAAVFKALLAVSRTLPYALLFASLEKIGKGMRTAPRDAIIAESMPEAAGKGFGMHTCLEKIGAIIGASLVFVLFWFFGLDFRVLIMVAAVVAVSSIIPLQFVREAKKEPQNISLNFGLRGLSSSLKLFMMVSAVFAMANFSYMFFILKAQQIFSGKVAVGAPIILYLLFNFAYSGFAIPFGAISDKVNRSWMLIIGYFLFALTGFGFVYFDSVAAFVMLFIMYGMAYTLIEVNQKAYVADLNPGALKATALGTFHTITGLVTLPASLIAGFLWHYISPTAPFLYAGVVSIASIIILILLKSRLK